MLSNFLNYNDQGYVGLAKYFSGSKGNLNQKMSTNNFLLKNKLPKLYEMWSGA